MKRVYIYYPSVSSPSGKMYFTAKGYFSSDRGEAQECYAMQFPSIMGDLRDWKENFAMEDIQEPVYIRTICKNTFSDTDPNYENSDIAFLAGN